MELKIGDEVEVTVIAEDDKRYFNVGAKGFIIDIDCDGDALVGFTSGHNKMCLGKEWWALTENLKKVG